MKRPHSREILSILERGSKPLDQSTISLLRLSGSKTRPNSTPQSAARNIANIFQSKEVPKAFFSRKLFDAQNRLKVASRGQNTLRTLNHFDKELQIAKNYSRNSQRSRNNSLSKERILRKSENSLRDLGKGTSKFLLASPIKEGERPSISKLTLRDRLSSYKKRPNLSTENNMGERFSIQKRLSSKSILTDSNSRTILDIGTVINNQNHFLAFNSSGAKTMSSPRAYNLLNNALRPLDSFREREMSPITTPILAKTAQKASYSELKPKKITKSNLQSRGFETESARLNFLGPSSFMKKMREASQNKPTLFDRAYRVEIDTRKKIANKNFDRRKGDASRLLDRYFK